MTANVGERFPMGDSYTAPERVASLTLVGPSGSAPMTQAFRREGAALATDVALPGTAGAYLAVMTIKPKRIEIPAAHFAEYLGHEGLDHVIAERTRLKEQQRPGRERYSRYAKLVLQAGDGPSDHLTRPVGLAAEIVPVSDITRVRPGGSVTVRLLVDGQPVSGALVGAIDEGFRGKADEWPLKARTDAQGQVTFALARSGRWLIRSVHMARRSGEIGPEAVDWESYWASLAFDVAP